MGIGDAFILFIGACSSETLMSHSVYMCAGISGKDLEERDGGFPSSYQYHFWVAMRARAVALPAPHSHTAPETAPDAPGARLTLAALPLSMLRSTTRVGRGPARCCVLRCSLGVL